MNYEVMPSGKYRVRKAVGGKRYSFTFDHIPKEREVNRKIFEAMQDREEELEQERLFSFEKAIDKFIEIKEARLSPSSIREFRKIKNVVSKEFLEKDISLITQFDVDREVSFWFKRNLAYKTMKNYFDSINAIIKKFTGTSFSNEMLPDKPKEQDLYIPTNEDVKRILQYLDEEDSPFYVAIALATYGLRRGEILALTVDDLDDDDVLHITKAVCQNEHREYVSKGTKTPASVRDINISHTLAERIRKQGYIYNCSPNSIVCKLTKVQNKLGIEHFSLHKLRHYFVTELWQMGVPIPDIKYLGGYEKNSDIMEVVYTHARVNKDKEKRKFVMDKFSDGLFET